MACTVHLAWDDELTNYNFGPGHPLAPIRVELTIELARALGVLDADGVSVVAPQPANDAQLEYVHDRRYVAAVKEAGAAGAIPAAAGQYGLGTPDDPIFPAMHEASALVAGATLAAARAVWSGQVSHGANIAGGLHHAMRDHASGFCVYNDPAIAISWLLEQGAERVGYVDIDVHHGDGVQAAFYDDPRVLTISLHESPRTLFPGTGRPSEIGGPGAEGSAVNVALPAGTRDAGWLRAFHAVVPPLLRTFRPHNLELTIDAQRAAHAAIHQLAHETAGGRWLLTGGGGYEVVQVVPRTWSHLLAEASGRPLDPAIPTPPSWRDYVARRTRAVAPEFMTEQAPATYPAFERGYDPAEPIDQAIMATRNAVFPPHGLMP